MLSKGKQIYLYFKFKAMAAEKNLFEKLSEQNQRKLMASDSLTIKELINSLKKHNYQIQPSVCDACDLFWFFHPMRVFDLTLWHKLFKENY